MANTVDLNNITEYDETSNAMAHMEVLARLLQGAKHAIVFTGAGISTSASIPDFRGPQGVWTRQAQGRAAPACVPLQQAIPTPCHKFIADCVRTGLVKYVVSQNIDGLHRRSGVPAEKISELHGNTFLEVCWSCNHQTEHTEEVHGGVNGAAKCSDCLKRVPHFCHCTGRMCPSCGAASMKDSIIHFGEGLPRDALAEAYHHAELADLCIVLGSSLTVSPANDIPKIVCGAKKTRSRKSAPGTLVIVNLQKTDLDDAASLRIFAKTDPVCVRLRELILPQSQPQQLRLSVGNTHRLVEANVCDGNRHEWTAFVEAPAGYVDRVEFRLHPTFDPACVVVKRSHTTSDPDRSVWRCTRLGWGTFTVGVMVYLKGQVNPISLSHALDFDQDKTSFDMTVGVS